MPVTREELGNVVVEPSPFPFPLISAVPAADAYRAVLATAGASLCRDAIDRRVTTSVTTETGTIITDPASVGGFATLPGGPPPPDSDRDGMPDTWERANGLNPATPGDGDDLAPDGYSDVERYLNSLTP